jgi:hypothetical protein
MNTIVLQVLQKLFAKERTKNAAPYYFLTQISFRTKCKGRYITSLFLIFIIEENHSIYIKAKMRIIHNEIQM